MNQENLKNFNPKQDENDSFYDKHLDEESKKYLYNTKKLDNRFEVYTHPATFLKWFGIFCIVYNIY